MGKFSREGDIRGSRTVQTRQEGQHIRQPLTLFLPVDVQSPQGVVQRFTAHTHLRSERLLREMLESTTELEVLTEIILPVHTIHGLTLLTIVSITLRTGRDRCSRIKNTLIENGHLTSIVVHSIVGSLSKGHTTGGDHDTTLRHIAGT